jgi:hypothetical protein
MSCESSGTFSGLSPGEESLPRSGFDLFGTEKDKTLQFARPEVFSSFGTAEYQIGPSHTVSTHLALEKTKLDRRT